MIRIGVEALFSAADGLSAGVAFDSVVFVVSSSGGGGVLEEVGDGAGGGKAVVGVYASSD